jgi:hypothetical protein
MRRLMYLLISGLSYSVAYADCSKEVKDYLSSRYSFINEGHKVRTTSTVGDVVLVEKRLKKKRSKLLCKLSFTVHNYSENFGLPEEWVDSSYYDYYTASVTLNSNSCDVLSFKEKRRK